MQVTELWKNLFDPHLCAQIKFTCHESALSILSRTRHRYHMLMGKKIKSLGSNQKIWKINQWQKSEIKQSWRPEISRIFLIEEFICPRKKKRTRKKSSSPIRWNWNPFFRSKNVFIIISFDIKSTCIILGYNIARIDPCKEVDPFLAFSISSSNYLERMMEGKIFNLDETANGFIECFNRGGIRLMRDGNSLHLHPCCSVSLAGSLSTQSQARRKVISEAAIKTS